MRYFLITVFVFEVLFLHASSKYFPKFDKEKISGKISRVSKYDFLKRVELYSEYFLKTPYRNNPLGEGKKKPLYDFRHFDCVTFIETVLALANTNNFKSAVTLLQKIRYKDGEISYSKRNHLMMFQWIPNNIKLGIIKNINEISDNVVYTEKVLSLSDFKGKFKKFRVLKSNLPLGKHRIGYIPVNYFLKNYKKFKIPSGTIAVIIRENRKDIPILASHLGFIIKKRGKYFFRSAVTNSKFKEVRDYPLYSYLNFYNKFYKKNWPIWGVSLYLPLKIDF